MTTEPSRPCGRPTRPTMTNSALLNDLEQDAAVTVRAACPHERAHRPRDASAPADHAAEILGRDLELDHVRVVLVELLDLHLVRLLDEIAREVLDELRSRRQTMFFALSRRETVSEGCAPFEIQSFTFASSNSISDGSCWGLYRPTISMNLPSRGERESATTTR